MTSRPQFWYGRREQGLCRQGRQQGVRGDSAGARDLPAHVHAGPKLRGRRLAGATIRARTHSALAPQASSLDVFGYGSTIVVDGGVGVGTNYNGVAGKAGVTLGFGGGSAPLK